MSGQSFQLVQGGVREMVETADGLVATGDVIPLEAPVQAEPQTPTGSVQLPPPRERALAAPAAPAPQPQPNQSVSPADVVRLAKARVKELKTELHKMKSLQKELSELEQLLGRSKKATTKNVRQLRSAV